MRKYLQVFYLSSQIVLEYRMNMMWRLSGHIVTVLLTFLLWSAILGSGFGLDKYTQSSLAVYYVSIMLVTVVSEYNYHLMTDDIRYGNLSIHLLKPYNYFLKVFIEALPVKIISLVVFLVVFASLATGGLFKIVTFGFLAALFSLALATAMRYFIILAIGGLAFWFNRVHGFHALVFVAGGIFSGELIPADLLPHKLAAISNYLPFKYLVYIPAHYFIHAPQLNEFTGNIIAQFFWILICYFVAKYIWFKGLREYESAGR